MNINEKFYLLEKEALKMLIDKDNKNKEILLKQLIVATIITRNFSGSGFFTQFSIPDNVLKIQEKTLSPLRGVYARINGLKIGVGFLLFLNEGVIDTLECYEYDDMDFPEEITDYSLSYEPPIL